MKKQLLLAVPLSSQAMPAFQKDFFNAIRDVVDAAEQALESDFSIPAFKQPKNNSTITLSADEAGVTARITNAPYNNDAMNSSVNKHTLILKHPAFTAAFKDSAFRRKNEIVYELAARISMKTTEEVQN